MIWPRPLLGPAAPSNGSIWPDIEQQLSNLVKNHRSTIIFANNRRTVEKLTARLNKLASSSEGPDGDEAPAEGIGFDEVSNSTPRMRAHHGSISLEERKTTETALKEGELAAVVATASLELGIDMGAVDLVCQVESPGNVARGLAAGGPSWPRRPRCQQRTADRQNVGRPARIRRVVLAAMLHGQIEHLRVPQGCLDVLAQQVIACVAMEPWDVPALFELVRGAYPYQNLAPDAFESVLRLVSGRFPTESFRDLRARVVWDRIHNRLSALPGTAHLALVGGGTIPDTGQFPGVPGRGWATVGRARRGVRL